LIFWKYSSRRI